MIRIFFTIVCLLLPVIAGAVVADTTTQDTISALILSPDQIEMGTFYHGANVQVSADIPECESAVLVLKVGTEEMTLNRKGRVAGIWLNVAQVTVQDVPKMYLLAASESLDRICDTSIQREMQLGVAYLRSHIHFVSEEPLTGSEFDEFMKFKKENGAYRMDLGVDLSPAEPGRLKLSARLPVPPTMPPGTYEVELLCFRGGQPTASASADVTLDRVGLARMMVDLAHDRSALYGILAVAVAMVVGLVMGVIFDSLPGAGH